ncbi:MAG: HD domain-containing phosphohydrolase [Candidatus Izemoplasmatales bacterium]
MNNQVFDKKYMLYFVASATVIVLTLFEYISTQNFLLFHTSLGIGMITLGIAIPVIGIISSFRLKDNILSRISPAIFIYTFLMLIHILSFPGMNIIHNVGNNFTFFNYFFANFILVMGFIVAILDRHMVIKTTTHLALATIFGILFFFVSTTEWAQNQNTDSILMISQVLLIWLYIVTLCLWYIYRKLYLDSEIKILSYAIILLLLSEIFGVFHFSGANLLASFSLGFKFMAFMLILYLTAVVNLILPYNELYEVQIQESETQKFLRKEISVSFERLKQSQQIAHVGTWELDIENDVVWASDEAFHIYGIPVTDDNSFSFQIARKMVFQEDRPKLDYAMNNLLTKKIPYNVFFRILNPNNEIHHINSIATCEYLDGKPYKVLGVIHDITELRVEEEKLIYASYHDELTDTYNRRYFVEQRKHLSIESYLPVANIILDINGLKIINDSFGHNAGNLVLKKVASVIKNNMHENGFLARIGGDEFAVMLTNTTLSEAEEFMKQINGFINSEKIGNINLSIAYGIAMKLNNHDSFDLILKKAEDEMYLNKMSQTFSFRNKIIDALTNTLFEKDNNSEEHSRRVSDYAFELAQACNLSQKKCSDIKVAGMLHDIGKVTISNEILNKEGKLNADEYTIIKSHSEKGYSIIHSIGNMDVIANYVLEHHERYDGFGYPKGIKGEDISFEARIIAIADAFDAMTSYRSYKKNKTKEEAVEELRKFKGTQFDPSLVDIFIEKVLLIK